MINKEKLKKIMDENIIPTTEEFEIGANTIYSVGSMIDYLSY